MSLYAFAMLFLCVVVNSKSGFNLFNAVSLPSQTALWFMNKFDATEKSKQNKQAKKSANCEEWPPGSLFNLW
jgi:hypothetical protein